MEINQLKKAQDARDTLEIFHWRIVLCTVIIARIVNITISLETGKSLNTLKSYDVMLHSWKSRVPVHENVPVHESPKRFQGLKVSPRSWPFGAHFVCVTQPCSIPNISKKMSVPDQNPGSTNNCWELWNFDCNCPVPSNSQTIPNIYITSGMAGICNAITVFQLYQSQTATGLKW